MEVDKGHCTGGIRTGSLSNSLLEKEQQVKRGIQRQRKRERRKRREGSGRSPDRVSTLPFFPLLFIPHLLIFPLPINYSIRHGRGADSSH